MRLNDDFRPTTREEIQQLLARDAAWFDFQLVTPDEFTASIERALDELLPQETL